MDIDDSRHHWRNRYLLMRHGHSQANAQGTIISSPERGLLAYGLSPQGEQQLADTVARWHWPVPTQVVHSDFLRTTHPAARVAAAFGLEMQKEERLRERHFGELEGKADSHYPEVWAFDAQNADHTQWQVEPVKRVAARMVAALEALEQRFEGETVLVVSHGDPLQILLTALAGKPLLHRQMAAMAACGVSDGITIIGGYRSDDLDTLGGDLVLNPEYATTNMVRTLFCAREKMKPGEDLLISYGDIVYEPAVILAAGNR